MGEAAEPLSQEDIDRLGVLAGMHVKAMPEDLSAEEQHQAIEQAVLDLEFEVIGMTNQQLTVPEEVDPNDPL